MTETAIVRPQTLNLQAIDLCNSRCVECATSGGMAGGRECPYGRIPVASWPTHFYSEVRFVGITGGEPTLRTDLFQLYELLPQCLPALKGAVLITHGMQTERAVETYSKVDALYRSKGLSFDGMVSLDGVGEVHDRVRRRKGAFESALNVAQTEGPWRQGDCHLHGGAQ